MKKVQKGGAFRGTIIQTNSLLAKNTHLLPEYSISQTPLIQSLRCFPMIPTLCFLFYCIVHLPQRNKAGLYKQLRSCGIDGVGHLRLDHERHCRFFLLENLPQRKPAVTSGNTLEALWWSPYGKKWRCPDKSQDKFASPMTEPIQRWIFQLQSSPQITASLADLLTIPLRNIVSHNDAAKLPSNPQCIETM